MIQQLHFWAFIQRKLNLCLQKISAPPGLLQHYLQWPRHGNNLSVHGWMDGWMDDGWMDGWMDG